MGRGGGGGTQRTWDCFNGRVVPEEEEGGAYPCRFSTPLRSNLEEQQQQPRVHYPMKEVTENGKRREKSVLYFAIVLLHCPLAIIDSDPCQSKLQCFSC